MSPSVIFMNVDKNLWLDSGDNSQYQRNTIAVLPEEHIPYINICSCNTHTNLSSLPSGPAGTNAMTKKLKH